MEEIAKMYVVAHNIKTLSDVLYQMAYLENDSNKICDIAQVIADSIARQADEAEKLTQELDKQAA